MLRAGTWCRNTTSTVITWRGELWSFTIEQLICNLKAKEVAYIVTFPLRWTSPPIIVPFPLLRPSLCSDMVMQVRAQSSELDPSLHTFQNLLFPAETGSSTFERSQSMLSTFLHLPATNKRLFGWLLHASTANTSRGRKSWRERIISNGAVWNIHYETDDLPWYKEVKTHTRT